MTVSGVDTKDDHQIVLDGTITAKREPDGVAWISDDLFASANEGDYQGGSRGWSIFDRSGRVVWDAGNSLEHLAVEHGLYPDKRSDAKGIEPENVAFARIRGVPYVFVNAERGNFTAVYDVSNPRKPRFQQILPTATRILSLSVHSTPAKITSQLTVTKDGRPVGYDAEGLVARQTGGYWLAVEGSTAKPNLLVRLDARGQVQQEVPLPADVAAAVTTNGYEGVAEVGDDVWVAIQRPLKTDPATIDRIGRYHTKTGVWPWLGYPLDAAPIGWTGLSELVAVDHDTFAVIERDNQRGPQASIKKIYAFDVPATWTGVPTVQKRLVKDLLPALRADHGWVQDKVEGLAVAA